MSSIPTPDESDALGLGDAGEERCFARDAWLHLRVLDHVDVQVDGAYTWDASSYAPVGVEQEDGQPTVVFAKT